MSAWSDETIAAYVDGELDVALRAELEAAVAADPALAERVEQERALRSRVEAAFGAVLDEPVPQRLLEALQPPVVIDLAAARAGRERRRWQWPEWGAMAACLAIGLFIGRALLAPADGAPFANDAGRLLARGALDRALTTQLAGEPGGGVTLPVSFASTDGRWCRSFVLARESLAGLACRADAGWQVELLATAEPAAPAGSVRPAATALPEPVLRAIDARIAGEPLDAAAERAAQAGGWRR
jgi:hypothetical protein